MAARLPECEYCGDSLHGQTFEDHCVLYPNCKKKQRKTEEEEQERINHLTKLMIANQDLLGISTTYFKCLNPACFVEIQKDGVKLLEHVTAYGACLPWYEYLDFFYNKNREHRWPFESRDIRSGDKMLPPDSDFNSKKSKKSKK